MARFLDRLDDDLRAFSDAHRVGSDRAPDTRRARARALYEDSRTFHSSL
jgi:hypothetical protein